MAIEIRQLVIRAVVDAGAGSNSQAPGIHALAGHGDAPGKVRASEPAVEVDRGGLDADERQAIVNACVREVLRKLERARER